MRPQTGNLNYEVFAVGEKLYCLWDHNIPALNLDFLKNVDHDYFKYLADVHSKELTGPNKMRAAVALHAAYFHGLETLFSLIFAGLQAPQAIPAWILKCKTEQLRTLIDTANTNSDLPKSKFVLADYSWKSIADFFNGVALYGNKDQDKGATELGELWQIFANDYVNKHLTLGYNSFKHGFRVKLGGMQVAFKPADLSNPNAPAGQYQEIAKSEYGTSFHEPVDIIDAPRLNPDRHFRVRDCHMNCHPEYAAESLQLISISIFNVVTCLKKLNMEKQIQGLLPPDRTDWLNDLRRKKAGLNNFAFDLGIKEKDITRFDDETLRKIFNDRRVEIKITKSSS